jgi:hypothetical protein
LRVGGIGLESYKPHPGIFRDLAGLDETPEAILRFATRYGLLGETTGGYEYLTTWVLYIKLMKEMVALGDALNTGNHKELEKALGPLSTQDLKALAERRQRLIAKINAANLTPDELVHVAATRLGQVLLTRKAFFERLELEGAWNAHRGYPELRLKHGGLLSFMFFQLGLSLIEGREFRQCAGCGKWFHLAPGVNRADRTTCSTSCRFKTYRLRRRQAVTLRSEGWSIKQIAKEIGSDASKIKQWLSKKA